MTGNKKKARRLAFVVGAVATWFTVGRTLLRYAAGNRVVIVASDPFLAVGFGLAAVCFAFALVTTAPSGIVPRRARISSVGVWLFASYVLIQTVFRSNASQELPRSLATCLLLISADFTGRWLGKNQTDFYARVGRWFARSYTAGILLAVVMPSLVFWTFGLFGASRNRAYFFWLVAPQPVLAVVFLLQRRLVVRPKTARLYTALIAVTVVLVALTRTRIYLVSVVGVLVVVFAARKSKRALIAAGFAACLLLLSPSMVDRVGSVTRLSAFLTNVDPSSGRADATNGRAALSDRLTELYTDAPLVGVGAQTSRDKIQDLDATSEVGIQFLFASYGTSALLVVLYVLGGFVRAFRALLHAGRLEPEKVLLCAAVVVIAPLSGVSFFGSASSFSDWLAFVLIATVLHMPMTMNRSLPTRVRSAPLRRSAHESPHPTSQ